MKFIALFASLTMACDDDDGNTQDTADATQANPDAMQGGSTLTYANSTLPSLGPEYVYEGWLIVGGEAKPAGRFSVDDTGVTSPASFALSTMDASAATTFILTIEPATGDDPAPSSTHIVGGDLSQGAATLSTNHATALGTDFAAAGGSYILATPTTGDDTLQEQGIWWLMPGQTPSASLVLPDLPNGWAYEGWIVGADGPVSTGRFTDTAANDSDGAGSTKGPVGDGPPFPGQDFINPATVLNGGSTVAVISVEPEPDNSAMPFLIKPLVHDPIGVATMPTSHMMMNNAAATLPVASITITAN